MEDIKKNEATQIVSKAEELKAKYGKVYRVGATIDVDDETEKTVEYFFKKPSTGSYDRYVKTTAQGATKPATVETGATVMVPLFVETGDVLKIDTRTGEYLSRV